MIVADVNLLAYLLISGPYSAAAQACFDRDSEWLVPAIWRFELLNVLATSVREQHLDENEAHLVWTHAPDFVRDAEVSPLEVLRLSVLSRFATYDCHYVLLAQKLNAALVTADKKLLAKFANVAVSIEDFAAGK